MSSTTDKIKGLANEAVGNIKQGVGSARATRSCRPKARRRN